MSIDIINGDLANPAHAQALVHLLSEYALDPMGGGKALPAEVLEVQDRIVPYFIKTQFPSGLKGLMLVGYVYRVVTWKPRERVQDGE